MGGPPAYGPPPHHPNVAPESQDRNRRTLIILGTVGAVLIGVIAVVAVFAIRMGDNHSAPDTVASAPSSPKPVASTARDCTHSVSSGEIPTADMVTAGGLAFPISVAPDWRRKAEHRVPNSIDAVSLTETVSEMEQMDWIGQLTVGITNFDPALSLEEQAKLMMKCIVASELYDNSSAQMGQMTVTPGRLDGTPTVRVNMPVTVTLPDPRIRGDDLVLVVVGTSPSTYFMGCSPIGDAGRLAVVEAALKELHISAV